MNISKLKKKKAILKIWLKYSQDIHRVDIKHDFHNNKLVTFTNFYFSIVRKLILFVSKMLSAKQGIFMWWRVQFSFSFLTDGRWSLHMTANSAKVWSNSSLICLYFSFSASNSSENRTCAHCRNIQHIVTYAFHLSSYY